jgi:pyruvate/2-oxoglutarate dehydrogenase complex dihydrolipoamide acyltransferase (E2) component
MTSGIVSKWHARPGNLLKDHDLIVDIRARSIEVLPDNDDLVDMEIELIENMFVAKILAEESEELTAGSPIAILCENEEDIGRVESLKVSLP